MVGTREFNQTRKLYSWNYLLNQWSREALATYARLQTDCVKLSLGQHQTVWCCLIGDVITRLGYFSAFGGRIGCPGLV